MNESRPEITLVRHGETPWSESGQHTGRTDIEALTATGEAQAQAIGPALAGVSFGLVLCSPMTRARRTAELAGLVPYVVDEDLREWDYGEFEGVTTDQIQRDYPGWTIWAGPWPGGEGPAQVAARADRVIASALAADVGHVALVAHGHILRVLAARWLGAKVVAGRWLALDTATISDLGWEHDQRVVRRWNQEPA